VEVGEADLVKAGDRILAGKISDGRWVASEPVPLEAEGAGLIIEG
jgi:hypothetical protein